MELEAVAMRYNIDPLILLEDSPSNYLKRLALAIVSVREEKKQQNLTPTRTLDEDGGPDSGNES